MQEPLPGGFTVLTILPTYIAFFPLDQFSAGGAAAGTAYFQSAKTDRARITGNCKLTDRVRHLFFFGF